MITPILVPLLNTNETEANLVELFLEEGKFVRAGEPLFTLETTKSVAEVTAEVDGYVHRIRFQTGETVQAGEILAYLSDQAQLPDDQLLVEESSRQSTQETDEQILASLRITQPALTLARESQLDLSELPKGQFITEKMVQSILDQRRGSSLRSSAGDFPALGTFDPSKIIVYGGGGHGKSVIEMLLAARVYKIIGVIDDGLPTGEKVLNIGVLGGYESLAKLHEQGVRQAVNAVGGIGNLNIRIEVFNRLERAGFVCPAIIHPSAVVEPSVNLSAGVQVFPLAYVGSEVKLGFGTIINTGAIVSHECHLGRYVNISPGAMLAGGVEVGEAALIGMGVTINLGVHIGAGARIGNGATIKSHVPDGQIVRAGSVWPAV